MFLLFEIIHCVSISSIEGIAKTSSLAFSFWFWDLTTIYIPNTWDPSIMGDRPGNKVGSKRSTKGWLTILELGLLGLLGVDEKKMKLEIN